MMMLEAINKGSKLSVGEGALYSLVSVLMVFAILFLIIGITALVFKLTNIFESKKSEAKEEVKIEDDDMLAATLVATADYHEETKKDVRVVSVKRVK